MPVTSLRTVLGYVAGIVAIGFVAATCSDLTGPTGLAPKDGGMVNILITVPPPGPALQLKVGDRFVPSVTVSINNRPVTRAQYVFATKDTSKTGAVGTADTIVSTSAHGDTLIANGRGPAKIIVSLVGATIGGKGDPQARTADTVDVLVSPFKNVVTAVGSTTLTSLGAALTLEATSVDATNKTTKAGVIVWSTSDPTVVRIDSTTGPKADTIRAFTVARGNGTAQIKALFDNTDSVLTTVTVQQVGASIRLSSSFGVGQKIILNSINQTIPVTATPLDARGNPLVAGSQALTSAPAFTTSKATDVDVNAATGLVTAKANTAAGSPATISVTAGTVGGTISGGPLPVEVDQKAKTILIGGVRTDTIAALLLKVDKNATALDTLGTQTPNSRQTWSSSNNNIISVPDPTVGTAIQAVGTGTATLKVTRDQAADSITIVVTNNPASVEMLPDTMRLKSLNDTAAFGSLKAKNANGATLTTIKVLVRSLDPSIADTLPGDTLLIAKATGVTFVVGTASGKADTSRVEVTNHPAFVDIIPTAVTLNSIGDTFAAGAPANVDFRNGRGVSLPPSSVTWSSADPTIATVSGDGLGTITAVGPGGVYIKAISPGDAAKRDSIFVTVTNAATSIVATPSPAPNLTAFGATVTFSATVKNAAGNSIPSGALRWSVPVGAAFVTIDPITGVATAVANGTATIRATFPQAAPLVDVTQNVSLTVAQAVAATRSTITPAPASIVANGTSTSLITVQLKDANDNNMATGGAAVTLASSLGSLAPLPPTDQGNGRYTSTLTSGTSTGAAAITGTVGGLAITNNAIVQLTAGAASKYLVTSNNSTPVAGAPVTIRAQLADVNNNAIATAGNVVQFSSTNGGSFTPVNGQATTDAAGVATITFTTNTSASSHTISAATGGLTGASTPIVSIPGSSNNYLVTASTTSPAAGAGVTISAQLRDVAGNAIAQPGINVAWTRTNGNGSFPGGATDNSPTNSSGVATIVLTTSTTSGATTVVTATGGVTGDSPPITTVVGPASAPQSTASVPAGTAGAATTITIQAKDAQGNNRTTSSGIVAVSVTGANTATPGVTDNGNGTYTTSYTPAVAGTDNIAITLGGVGISGSPFTSVVSAGGVANFLVEASGGGSIAQQAAGATFNIKITARDAGNNTATGFTGTVVLTSTGTLTGAPVTSAAFTAGVLSTQAVTITNTGSFTITATNGGQTGVSSAFSVSPGAASAAQSTASVPAGIAGAVTTITVQAKDAQGNNRTTTSGAVVVSVTGANTATASVTDNGNGTYTATYTPTASGTDNIAITLGGTAISGSPFTSAVSAAALHHFAVTNTSDLPIGSQAAGTSFNIKVVAQDANNNTVTTFTGTVSLTSTGTLTGAPVTSAAFVAGVLSSQAATITNIGTFSITATRSSGGAQTGSSNNFAVTTGAASAAQSTASVPAGTAGLVTTITIQAKDVNGNNRTSSSGAVVVSVTGANTATASVTDNLNGTYTATYTPTVAGNDNIAITLGGSAISGSPFTSAVSATALDHFAITNTSDAAIGSQIAGTSFNIRIRAKDQFNNTVPSFTGTVVLTSTGTLTGAPVTTGAFTAGELLTQAVTITNTGSFTITAAGSGKTGTSNSFPVGASAAVAGNSTASVPAGISGSLTTITIQAKDANSNNLTTGGSTVQVTVSGANTVAQFTATDNGNGTYTATYTPTAVGTDNIAITLGGTPISGSPYPSIVSAGAVANFLVEAQGGGAIGTQTAGASFNIRITARDANGNTATGFTGAGNAVTITSSSAISAGSGTTATFTSGVLASRAITLTTSGSQTITATRAAGGIETGVSAAFTVNAGTAAAAQTTASVPAGTAGSLTTITVQAKDAFGNNRTTTSGVVAASVTGANTATGSVTDNTNGTYTITYTPTNGGTDAIAITLGGTAISGSPYSSVVGSGVLDHFLVDAQGGGAIGTQTAGTSFSIRIVAQDVNNNTVPGFSGTVVLTSTGTLTGAPVTTAAFTNGVLSAQSATITNTGSFTITATGGGKNGTSNTFAVNTGAASAAQSTASVPAGTAGSVTTITVQAKDANGNNRTSTSGTVVVSVTGANTATASVTDNLNGTYTATYTPTASGTDNTAITLGGSAISGSPFTSVVSVGALANFLVEASGGGSIASQTAGTSFNIRITARDANNNTATGFTGTVVLTSTGTLTGAPVTTAAFTAGVLSSQAVTITNTGSFTITATGSGKTGASNTFSVVTGAASAAQSTASVPAGSAGSLTTITVQAKDANGNNRTSTSGAVVVSVTGANAASASVTDNLNGTYTATYTPTVVGTDNIAITLGGTAISGSPYSSVVSAGAVANFLVEAAAGGAIPTQTAGTSFNIKVTARDANNNTATNFTGTVQISSTGTLSAGSGTTPAFVAGVLASRSVTITNTGSWTITATRTAGAETGTSAAFSVDPGAASAAQSTASVPAGTAGSVTTITVQAKDAFGNNRTSTSGVVAASVTGANTATGSVTDNTNGTYTITYTPTNGGTDAIAITLGGTAISGSPYSSVVGSGLLDHFLVDAQGGGAIGTQTAGTSFNIRIIAQDVNNNTVPGFTGTVVLTSTGALTGTPVTSGSFVNGVLSSQTVTITNSSTPTFTITATGGGKTGTSNAFAVVAGAASAAQSTASVPAGTAGSVTTITVQAKDANGNNRTSTSGTVAVAVTGANTATASVTDNLNGTYTATYTPTVAGTDNIAITLGGGAISGSPFTSVVGAAALDHFVVTNTSDAAIGTQTAGTSFNIRIRAKDVNNNTVTGFTGTVVLTSTGTLTGAPVTSAAFTAGELLTQAVTITNTGSFTITATGSGKTGTSNAFTVDPGAVSATASTASVPAGTAGSVTTITVQAKDANGNNRPNATGITAVAASVTGANTATPSVTNNNNGTYTLTYTPTATGTDNVAITMDIGGGPVAISGSPYSSVVSAGAVANFLVEAAAGGAIPTQTAGTSFNIKITARDANNNTVPSFTGAGSTVNITSSSAISAGSGTTATFTNGVLASHTITLTTSGSQTVTATRTSGGSQNGTSASFTVNPDVLDHFAVTNTSGAAIGTQTAATAFNIKVIAQDQFNNTQTGFVGTVSFTSSSTISAGAGPSAAFVSGVLASHSITLSTSGTHTITATGGGKTGQSNSFTVNAATATQYIVTSASSVTAGSSIVVTAQLADVNNNPVLTSGRTVVWSKSGPGGTFATPTSLTDAAGQAQVAFTGTLVGAHTVTATDNLALTGTSGTITVNPGTATQIAATGSASQTAGVAQTVTLTAKDFYGNVATGYVGSKNLTFSGASNSPAPSSTVPTATNSTPVAVNFGSTTAVTFTAGVGTSSVVLYAAETANIAVTDGSISAAGANRLTVAVTAATASQLKVTGTGTQIAGTSQTMTITAQDAFRNTATGYTGAHSLTFSGANSATTGQNPTASNNAAADVDFGTATAVTFASGVGSSTLKLYKAETALVNASDGTINATGNELSIVVSAAALDNFNFVLQTPQTDGVAFIGTNTLTARDVYNNTKTTFNASTDNVTIAANAPLTGAVSGLSGGNKLTTAGDFVSGVANLTGSMTYIGNTNTGTFTATSASAKSGISGAVQINVGAASTFTVTGGPGTLTAGGTQAITITAKDVGSNTATGYTGTKSLTFSGATASPSAQNPTASNNAAADINFGIATNVDFTAGVATSNIKLYKAETANIAVADGGITTPSPLVIVVSAAGASTSQSTVSSTPLTDVLADGVDHSTVTVQLKDAFQNITTTGVTTVSATLTGTATNAAIGAFTTGGGGTYTASLTSTTFGTAITTAKLDGTTITHGTNPVTVTFVASRLVVTSGNPTPTAGVSESVTITAKDADGNTATSYGGSKNLIFSGASDALTGQHPTADAVNFGTTTPVTFTNGVGSVAMILYRAEGPINIAVTTTAPTTPTIVAAGTNRLAVTVAPADASTSQSTVSASPLTNVLADGVDASTVTVQLKDAFQNITTTGVGSGVDATLSGTATTASIGAFTTGGGGTYTASLTSTTFGTAIVNARINAVDITHGSNPQTVTFVASRLVMTSGNATPTAGVSESVTITAKDAAGNTVTSYTGSKSLTFGGASNALTGQNPTADAVNFGSATSVSFTNGVGSVAMILYRAEGPINITATQPAAPSISSGAGADRLTVTVIAADASTSQSTVSATPLTDVLADGVDASTVTVQLKDAFQNITTTGVTTVSATLTGTATTASIGAFTTGGGGTYTASLTSTTFGTAITTTKLDGVTITHGSNPVTVTFVASRLVVTSGNPTPTAGVSEAVTITAKDAAGNTATSYSGSKNLIFSGASDALTGQHPTADAVNFGTTTPVTFTNGVGSVAMILYRAEGPINIAVTTTAPTTPTIVAAGGDQLSVTVGDAGLDNFGWSLTSPQTTAVAFTGTNTLTARDQYNNTVVGFDASTNAVTVSVSPSGTVSGLGSGGNDVLDQGVDFVNGVANLTGKLVYTRSAAETSVTFTATSAGPMKTGTSAAVAVGP